MICPSCGHVNTPGDDQCGRCQFDLMGIDAAPVGQDVVEANILTETVLALKPKTPVTIPLDALLGLALDRMVAHGVGALLVVDDAGKLCGILTERDYVRKVIGLRSDYVRLPLRDFMTPDPETIRPDDRLAVAIQKMDVGGYRHLPVVDDGRPVGLISVRDVIRHITRLCDGGR